MPLLESAVAPWEDAAEPFCAPTRSGPLVPLDAPGMPPAGPDFLLEAARMVGAAPEKPQKPKLKKPKKPRKSDPMHVHADYDQALFLYEEANEAYETDSQHYHEQLKEHGKATAEVLAHLYRQALYEPGFQLPVLVKNKPRTATFVPGHLFRDEDRVYGPTPAEVMLLGKNPGPDSIHAQLNLAGPRSVSFFDALEEAGFSSRDTDSWYVAKMVKHDMLDPASDRLAASWIKNCAPLLHQELRLVRPKFILCLGAEPAKELLGETVSVSGMTGRAVAYEIPGINPGEPSTIAKVMVVISPKHVFAKPEAYPDLRDGVRRFAELVRGEWDGSAEDQHDHEVVYSARRLKKIVDEIVADPKGNTIALDCEWHGEYPGEPCAYLRTIQFSHRSRKAYTIVLRSCGGVEAFQPSLESALPELKRLCKSTSERPVRVGGHFFRADLPWLEHYGLDLKEEFAAPESAEATRTKGGFDTGYMLHAVYESAVEGYQLEPWAVRLTGAPRYDTELRDWKKAHPEETAGGYGLIPDEILHPYSLFDVDVTMRLFDVLNGVDGNPGLLDCDSYGLNSRDGFFHSQGAALAFLEMEMTGMSLDKPRGVELTNTFAFVRNALTEKLRAVVEWPTFNPNSPEQTRELLFGESLNGTFDPATGQPKRLRPPEAKTLGLTPVKTTGKRAKSWEQVVAANEEDIYNSGTDKEVLGILGYDSPEVKLLRDTRFVGQVLKSVLRMPRVDKQHQIVMGADGFPVYDGGLMSFVMSDGRVRTHFYPVETGRCSSSRPPLQNLGSRREKDYKRILAEHYRYPSRSLLRASPGHVFVEADLKSAEVAALAWLSNDVMMIEDVRLAMLPEDDPEYVDIHAKTAVEAFRLSCPPTKKGLEELGKSAIRVAAKNVRFGIPYGRGAESLARQCREEGAPVTVADCQGLINSYYERYPNATAFLEECAARARNERWLCGTFGRKRRCSVTMDRQVQGELERQFKNFLIQNLVADAIAQAMRFTYEYRARHTGPETFRHSLQIHDALLLEVPIDSVEWVIEDVLPRCMCDMVPIYPCDMDGNRLDGVGPYHFGIDTKVQIHWGENIGLEEGRELGLPEKYLKAA